MSDVVPKYRSRQREPLPFQAADDPLPEPRPPETPWRPIADAPRDGTAIMVKRAIDTEGAGTPAVYRRSRRYREGRWLPVEFWGDPVTKWPIKFEPGVWRKPSYGEALVRR